MKVLYLFLWLGFSGPVFSVTYPVRIWRAVGGYETRASFVAYHAGTVTLRKEDGSEVSLPLGRLQPADRTVVIELASHQPIEEMPPGPVEKPSGRREITWSEIEGHAPWPQTLPPDELKALQSVGRSWKHAQSRYFILHYQSLGYAKKVSRMADFLYQYIASDLPGFRDRSRKKSHIVVIRNREEWVEFLQRSGAFADWAAAFVRGDTMFLYDMDDRVANASILAHEMSHLVLNRFFVHRPPLWLNEGLAEWYGNTGHESFKGLKVDPKENMGRLENPYLLSELFPMDRYPEGHEQISRFYSTSKQVVGMLMLRREQSDFVRFLEGITVKGLAPEVSLEEIYGLGSIPEVQAAFLEFLQ